MKKIITLENYSSSWGTANRVDALLDWFRDSQAPFDINVSKDYATIIIDSDKSKEYENTYAYESDLRVLNSYLNDIKDPISAGDGFRIHEIDLEKADINERNEFINFLSNESFDELTLDSIRVLGLDVPEQVTPVNKTNEPAMESTVDRMKKISEMLAHESYTPEEEPASVVDNMLGDVEDNETAEETEEIVSETDDNTSPVNVADIMDEVNVDNGVIVPEIDNIDEVEPEPTTEPEPEQTPAVAKVELTDLEIEVLKEFVETLNNSNITMRDFVNKVVLMKRVMDNNANAISNESVLSNDELKALIAKRYPLNLMAKGIKTTEDCKKLWKDISQPSVTPYIELGEKNGMFVDKIGAKFIGHKFGLAVFLNPKGTIGFIDNDLDNGKYDKLSTIEEDIAEEAAANQSKVSGSEDYSYQNAVPYIQDPNSTPDSVPTQSVNIATESVNPINEVTNMTSEDIYNSLLNSLTSNEDVTDTDFILTDDFTMTGLEAFYSKQKTQPNDNQVLADINKIIADAKKIAKKAFQELRDKNAAIFEKYGAFIKILLDIKDIVFMDKRYIKLEIARFNTQKANSEEVPDTMSEGTTKVIADGVSDAVTSSMLGPFHKIASGGNKPANQILKVANDVRKYIIHNMRKDLNKYPNTTLTLNEDEVKGVYTLELVFLPFDKPGMESVEEEQGFNLKKIASECKSDDELFKIACENINEISEEDMDMFIKYNMKEYLATGEKVPNMSVISTMRRMHIMKSKYN